MFFYLSCLYVRKYKLEIEGKKNIPENKGPCVLVSNHLSYDDIPLIGVTAGYYLAFIAKKELFEMPVLGPFLKLAGVISVDREKLEKSTIKYAKEALQLPGWRVAIFIEGTRSRQEGYLGKPNNGPVYIARLTGVPLVPIGISYGPGRKVNVKIGEAYEVDRAGDLEEQSWECLEKISKLSGKKMPEREGA